MKKKKRLSILMDAADYQIQDLEYRLKNCIPEESKSLTKTLKRTQRALLEELAEQRKPLPPPNTQPAPIASLPPIPVGTYVRHEVGEVCIDGKVLYSTGNRVKFEDIDGKQHNVPLNTVRRGPIFGVVTQHWQLRDLVERVPQGSAPSPFGVVVGTDTAGGGNLTVQCPGYTQFFVWPAHSCRLLRRG